MANVSNATPPVLPPRYRGRVGINILLVTLALGPAIWFVQLIINYCLVAHACYPDSAPLLRHAIDGLWWLILAINLIGVALALFAAFTSWRNFRVARGARPLDPLSDIYFRFEARAAFLAGWGGIVGLGFFSAAIGDLIALLVVPPCLG
jgi:hypothetical protein